MQAAASFILGYSILIDAALYAIGGFFLRRFQSRVAAILLLLLAVIGVGSTIANVAGAQVGGGNNIILAIIILGAAARAVEATFKYHGKFSKQQQD